MRRFPACLLLVTLGLTPAPLLAQRRTRMPAESDPQTPEFDTRRPVISGYVRFEKGARAEGPVLVKLETDSGSMAGQSWTGSSGRFEFYNVPRGLYYLVVSQAGCKDVRIQVDYSMAPVEGITISLVPEDKQNPSSPQPSVSVRQLLIPEKARNEYDKGLEALGKKNTAESIDHFRKAIEIYPAYDDAYNQLGWIYVQQHAYFEAQGVLEKAIKVNEKNAGAYALLGSVYRAQNRVPESVQALEHSLSLEEVSWFTHLELGQLLVKQGKVNEGYPHLVRAHQLNPDKASVHVALYNALILRNDNQAALTELDEFLKLFPEHPLAPQVRQQREALQTAAQRQRQ